MFSKKGFYFLFLLLAAAWLSCAPPPPSKLDREYPQYVTVKNTRDTLLHVNDTTLMLNSIAKDPEYGRVPEKPVMLGMLKLEAGADNRSKYLNALRGPRGEPVHYRRLKACCPFKTPNQKMMMDPKASMGLLERYELSYDGLAEPVILYLNLYDNGPIEAPKGFTIAKL
jgi:hypothetical protein